MSILFVTNTNLKSRKGGWDGLAGKIFDLLKENLEEVDAMDNLNPSINYFQLTFSRIQKVLSFSRIFPAFTRWRLTKISTIFHSRLNRVYDHVLFHGATPWIKIRPKIPYSVLVDCSFATYIKVYHSDQNFNIPVLRKIINQEKTFYANAHTVFFTSHWALMEASKEFEVEGNNFILLKQGPSEDFIHHSKVPPIIQNQFLFIATHFEGKGGLLIYNSFIEFSKLYPDYKWIIVGQQPPDYIIKHPQIEYLGYINKSTTKGRNRISKLYAESKANILISSRDILPLVIIESGCAGCPTIASPFAAIPEIIEHGRTGWLVEPIQDDIIQILKSIAAMEDLHLTQMRETVKHKMKNEYNWEIIIKPLMKTLSNN